MLLNNKCPFCKNTLLIDSLNNLYCDNDETTHSFSLSERSYWFLFTPIDKKIGIRVGKYSRGYYVLLTNMRDKVNSQLIELTTPIKIEESLTIIEKYKKLLIFS